MSTRWSDPLTGLNDRREYRLKWLVAILIGLIFVGGLATACAAGTKGGEQFQDADRAGTNSAPADTITFPDGFSNAATKCDHGNRVYVLFHGDSVYGGIAVVPADPTCKGAS